MTKKRTPIPNTNLACLIVACEEQPDVSADYADYADSVKKREAAVFEGSGSPGRLMKKEGKRAIHELTQNKNKIRSWDFVKFRAISWIVPSLSL